VTRTLAVLLVAAILLGLAAAPAGAATSLRPDAAPAAKKKPKKCKKRQVRVRLGKRVSCRPAKKVLPKPKAGDVRLMLAQSAVAADWSRLRNRRGKRVPSLPKLIRKLGPRAPGLLAKATKRGIARVDALAASSLSSARLGSPADAWPAAAGCANVPQGARRQDSFTSNGGDGTQARVTATLGPEGAAMAMEMSGQGLTVKLDLDFGCEPESVQAPSCPTAVGRLPGEIRYKLRAAVEISRGDEDVWSQVLDVSRKTELEGWTDVDAKLDRLDVKDVQTSNFSLGGSVRGFPPISIRTRIVRTTQVDMRSGSYVPDRSDISVTVNTAGLSGPDRADVEDDLEQRARPDADRQFAAIVDKAIDGYRSREQAWQQPEKCAKLEFSPASDGLRLRANQAGSFSATAIAKEGGGASELDAKLSNQSGATFSPTRAGGQSARFDYTVTAARGKAKATVRATSKAGVDEKTWEQPIEDPFEINVIAGTFSGSTRHHVPSTGFDSRFSWSGNATFARVFPGLPGAVGDYTLVDGVVTYTASGTWYTGVADCQQSGSKSFDLPDGSGSIGVSPTGPDPFVKGPHEYGAYVSFSDEMTLTLHSCVPGAEDYEGTQHPAQVGGDTLDTSSQQSPDGVDYSGTRSETEGGASASWNWTLTGTK
jgi:hypothetical protein